VDTIDYSAALGEYGLDRTLTQSGKLLPKERLAEATKAHMGDYGFGFSTAGQGALRHFGHGGGAPGMNGDLRIYPESGLVIVVLSNLDPPAAANIANFLDLRISRE
jgi:D-alanyl-D-alanine carboxypeptidase